MPRHIARAIVCSFFLCFAVQAIEVNQNSRTQAHEVVHCQGRVCFFVTFFFNSKLTEEEKKEYTRIHNQLRGNVSPPAKKMPALVWDEYIGKKASIAAQDMACIHSNTNETHRRYNVHKISLKLQAHNNPNFHITTHCHTSK